MFFAMCGRVAQITDPIRLARQYGIAAVPPNAPPRYNGAPTQDLLVVRCNPKTGIRHLDLLRWGLVPHWATDAKGGARMINARAESCTSRAAFRDAYRQRRCLVPVDAFFEWRRGDKQPFAIALANGEPMALAGLWEGWKDARTGEWLRTFTIITTAANALVEPLHDRMPAIIAPEHWPLWLGEVDGSAEELAALLAPYPSEQLRLWPVSRRINRVKEDTADLLAEVAPLES